MSQQESGGTPVALSIGEAVVQPLGDIGNVARCSLAVIPSGYIGARCELVGWNPATLAPDPTTLALRTFGFAVTDRVYPVYRWDVFPQVITRALPQVAEPPAATTALTFRLVGLNGTMTFVYDANGDPVVPVTYRVPVGGPAAPLGSPHAVTTHTFCGGDEFLQSLYVVQSVMTTSTTMPSSSVEFIQKFRLPVAATIQWAEFGLGPVVPDGTIQPGRIRIMDAVGQAEPPLPCAEPPCPAPLLDAVFYPSDVNTWSSHLDLVSFPLLQANHDYWLVMTTNRDYAPYVKILTGAESPYFTTTIGPLFARATMGAAAAAVPGRALNFRLIGVPHGTVGVEPAVSVRGGLSLAVAPNPSRGAAVVTWSGARDDVRFEVLDARGRRVASGSAGAGGTSRWTWNGRGDDGIALPAGMYFVRARDAAGRLASTRVSLVR